MATDAAKKGQLASAGVGTKGKIAAAIAPAPVTRRVVSTSLLSPDLMKAFHEAWSNAASNTRNITSKDTMPFSSLHCLHREISSLEVPPKKLGCSLPC
jgi:hypothetical protein